ncbi:hypothetical protein NGB36_10745 [Streptomyces sp. RB6PN25]|uniref:Integral membrane protein n=1 Tax=Streptomyces humicola TaxID=2953240 RepID=A0ABT1PTR0_9ACTN|nr:hypothetical protein [Streptomyces humicola]MCQ4081066.1 hypothetical protein [Streptomyces humicola]
MTVPVRAGADLRLLRAVVFSAVCVTLSAAGHAMASGAGVPLWTLAAGWAGVLCVAAPLAGRERSLPGIASTLLAGELGLHLLFCLGQSSAMAVPADNSGGVMALAERLLCNGQPTHLTPQRAAQIVRQSGINPARAMGGMPGMSGMAGMVGHGAHAMSLSAMFTAAMLAAHLTAAVIVGWMLRRGEAALWQLVRLYAVVAEHLALLVPLSGLLAAMRVLALVAGLLEQGLSALRPARVEYQAGRFRVVALQHCVIRRGPPAVALAA